MRKIHSDLFNTVFDEKDTDFFYSVINPVELKSIVNKVSRVSSEIRDAHIVKKICEYVLSGYSVYLQYGASHAVMQEPALRELIEMTDVNINSL